MPLIRAERAVTAVFAVNVALETVAFEFSKPVRVLMFFAVGYGIDGFPAIRPRAFYFYYSRNFIFFREGDCLRQ